MQEQQQMQGQQQQQGQSDSNLRVLGLGLGHVADTWQDLDLDAANLSSSSSSSWQRALAEAGETASGAAAADEGGDISLIEVRKRSSSPLSLLMLKDATSFNQDRLGTKQHWARALNLVGRFLARCFASGGDGNPHGRAADGERRGADSLFWLL